MSFKYFSAFRSFSLMNLFPSSSQAAECKDAKNEQAEKAADDLSAIMQGEGNFASDPEAMMRLIEARQSKL